MAKDKTRSVGILQDLNDRKQRCQQRLENEPTGYTYFALIGTELAEDLCPIGETGFIRIVDDSPNIFELAGALADKALTSAVERYSFSITHELAVKNHPDDPNMTMAIAWAITAALRIRSVSDFLVPLAAAHSWSTIAALPQDSCAVWLIEDVPKARKIGWQRPIRTDDCNWVEKHFRNFTALHDEANFQMAVESFSTQAHHANLRMSTAALWAGIEGLFAVNSELRFRISALVATALEPRGETRLALYRRMKILYDFRSKAVHGSRVAEQDLMDHIVEVRFVLARLLSSAIENGKVATAEELELELFA